MPSESFIVAIEKLCGHPQIRMWLTDIAVAYDRELKVILLGAPIACPHCASWHGVTEFTTMDSETLRPIIHCVQCGFDFTLRAGVTTLFDINTAYPPNRLHYGVDIFEEDVIRMRKYWLSLDPALNNKVLVIATSNQPPTAEDLEQRLRKARDSALRKIFGA